MKKFFDGRKGMAFTLLLLSAGLTLVFGAGLSLLTKNFWDTCVIVWGMFFAPAVVSAALLLLTNIEEDLSWQFGMGLYYGAAVCDGVHHQHGQQVPPERVSVSAQELYPHLTGQRQKPGVYGLL